MAKRILCAVLLLCMTVMGVASAARFSDVPTNHPSYDAIVELSEQGIINGYSDGTFKPDGNINRAEAATILVRAAELNESSRNSSYSDVENGHWARGFIMAATDAGIINGLGDGRFAPYGNVTHNQIIKMIVCMLGFESQAMNMGGWPYGYTEKAVDLNIIDFSVYSSIKYNGLGDAPATRQAVASYLAKALTYRERQTLSVGGEEYRIGMSADCLGHPDETLASTGEFTWYVYGTDTYRDFYAVGVDENKIVALASSGLGFRYMGYQSGDRNTNKDYERVLFSDSNDGGVIHGVLIVGGEYGFYGRTPTAQELAGESKMNFHFTNAFRVYHGRTPFLWSDVAADAARLHSEDMARYNYFDHTSLDGSSHADRMTAQGIDWFSCGENIAAGTFRYLGFDSYDGWVNSAGHRSNLLNHYTYLGVGIAYNPNSTYNFYHTQDFFR